MSVVGFVVRAAVAEDVAEVIALERATVEAPHWAEVEYAAIVRVQEGAVRRCLVVAEVNGTAGRRLVGFAVGKVIVGGGCAELESVAVDERARRGGVGRALCGAIAGWCKGMGAKELELEVRASSAGAIALYEGLGFVANGRRSGYYEGPPDDALLMTMGL